jgi:hypothetical protein
LSRHFVRIEVVAEEELTAKLALRPFIDDHLVALLAHRLATGADVDNVALDGDIHVVLGDAR